MLNGQDFDGPGFRVKVQDASCYSVGKTYILQNKHVCTKKCVFFF